MSEDASLDDFVGAGSTERDDAEASDDRGDVARIEEGASETEPAAGEAQADDGPANSNSAADTGVAAVSPAVSTYDWAPDGAPCADCGTVVDRRWRDGADLVCSDCKRW